jgi:Hint domain
MPIRDLWVSPGHPLLVDGVLIQAQRLVNGASIAQIPFDRVQYWHVELDSHDIVLAEGLPAERYLDTGNRTAFTNGGAFLEAYPDFEPKYWAQTCKIFGLLAVSAHNLSGSGLIPTRPRSSRSASLQVLMVGSSRTALWLCQRHAIVSKSKSVLSRRKTSR